MLMMMMTMKIMVMVVMVFNDGSRDGRERFGEGRFFHHVDSRRVRVKVVVPHISHHPDQFVNFVVCVFPAYMFWQGTRMRERERERGASSGGSELNGGEWSSAKNPEQIMIQGRGEKKEKKKKNPFESRWNTGQ